MATLYPKKRNASGKQTIQFTDPVTKKRPKIHLGKMTKRQAEGVKTHIEHLIVAKKLNQTIPDQTCDWVNDIRESHPELAKRLVQLELIVDATSDVATNESIEDTKLMDFFGEYIENFKSSVKPGTVITYQQALRLLSEYFPANKTLRELTEGDAIEFLNHLKTRHVHKRFKSKKKMAESTIRRRCGCIRQILKHAVRKRLIDRNPFACQEIRTTLPRPRPKRFVAAHEATEILEKLPDPQWQLLFALLRWGGLRGPSEPEQLRWRDIDWERRRMTVHSPKTEHHPGRDKRLVPLFPELVPLLKAVMPETPAPSDRVLPFMEGKLDSSWYRHTMRRAIKEAGYEPWKKLLVTLRASRATELRNDFKDHVVNAWIGHSQAVAQQNYLQTTEEDFSKAVQNQVQHLPENREAHEKAIAAQNESSLVLPVVSAQDQQLPDQTMGDTGLELLPITSCNTTRCDEQHETVFQSGAKSGASEVVSAWNRLSPAQRDSILSIVRQASTSDESPKS